MTDTELTQHIKDCGKHMLACYERFEAFGDPTDRQAAVEWLEAQKQAQQALSPAAKAAWEAEIQASIDNGLDYFQARGAADRERLVA